MRIAVTGKARSGKDAVGKILIEKQGFERIRFAGALKEMTRAFLRYRGCPETTIERMIEGDLKEEPMMLLNGKSPREWMQWLGKSGRDGIHQNLWVDTELDRPIPSRAVCLDCRYNNEAKRLRQHGFIILARDGGGLDGETANHESEDGIAEHLIDHVVPRYDSLERLEHEVLRFVTMGCPKGYVW